MRLDRNTGNGDGKYAVVKMRRVREIEKTVPAEEYQKIKAAIDLLEEAGVLTYGGVGARDEFFVIMLKYRYAGPALEEYARRALAHGDVEYANDVDELRFRADSHPEMKDPD